MASSKKSQSKDAKAFSKKVRYYTNKLGLALEEYESEHPEWRKECLFWLMERCLHQLQHYIESPSEKEVSWASPFVELHFPVECQWFEKAKKTTFSINSGVLTQENLRDKKTAVQTLTQLMIRQIEIVTLQDVTHVTAYEQNGDNYTPMLGQESLNSLDSLDSDEERSNMIRSLLQPCSFGGGTIELPVNIKHGDTIPEYVAIQLSKIQAPLLSVPLTTEGEGSQVIVIFEVHPLVVNFARKTAYYPLRVGLTILPEKGARKGVQSPPWMRFTKWSAAQRTELWTSLFAAISIRTNQIWPTKREEMEEAIITVNAQIRIRKGEGVRLKDLQNHALAQLQQMGEVLQFEIRTPNIAASSIGPECLSALKSMETAKTSQTKGRSLEKLMAALFSTVQGFKVSERIHTKTEEIDLFIENESDVPVFKREADVILVECKNWSKQCGKDDFVLFQKKMANRGGRCSIGFLVSWNGFAGTITMEMLRSSRETLLVVPLDGKQIRAAVETGDFLDCLLKARKKALTI